MLLMSVDVRGPSRYNLVPGFPQMLSLEVLVPSYIDYIVIYFLIRSISRVNKL